MLLKNPLALATGSFIQSLISFYLFRVNDTEEIESHRRRILISSWCLVVLLPLLLLVSWLYLGQGHPSALLFLLILIQILLLLLLPLATLITLGVKVE